MSCAGARSALAETTKRSSALRGRERFLHNHRRSTDHAAKHLLTDDGRKKGTKNRRICRSFPTFFASELSTQAFDFSQFTVVNTGKPLGD
jgi:hypothetical protein